MPDICQDGWWKGTCGLHRQRQNSSRLQRANRKIIFSSQNFKLLVVLSEHLAWAFGTLLKTTSAVLWRWNLHCYEQTFQRLSRAWTNNPLIVSYHWHVSHNWPQKSFSAKSHVRLFSTVAPSGRKCNCTREDDRGKGKKLIKMWTSCFKLRDININCSF